jgi:hypothetical protein
MLLSVNARERCIALKKGPVAAHNDKITTQV